MEGIRQAELIQIVTPQSPFVDMGSLCFQFPIIATIACNNRLSGATAYSFEEAVYNDGRDLVLSSRCQHPFLPG